jgi:hypothetical protein
MGKKKSTQQSEVRSLLRDENHDAVRRGIQLLCEEETIETWNSYAEGVKIIETLEFGNATWTFDIKKGSEIERDVAEPFRLEVALWAIQKTRGLGNAFGLNLSNSSLRDLEVLEGCSQLQRLVLDSSRSLTSLQGLRHCPNLELLNLRWCDGLTNFEEIRFCSKLIILNLRRTRITSFKGLGHFQHLDTLDISRCFELTDLSQLGPCPRLLSINLEFTNALTSLEGIKGFPRLSELNIRNAQKLWDYLDNEVGIGLVETLEGEELAEVREYLRLPALEFLYVLDLDDLEIY